MLLDDSRATVTAPRKIASGLQRQLKMAGASVTDIALHGRFHNECNQHALDSAKNFCESQPAFQFPSASEFVLPTRSNTDGEYVRGRKLHAVILQSMLLEQSNWRQAFYSLQESFVKDDDAQLFSFGPENCIPPLLSRRMGQNVIHLTQFSSTKTQLSKMLLTARGSSNYKSCLAENGIAIVGMSCQFPGANDLEEYWSTLMAGQSQHTEVPSDRFTFETLWRDQDPKRQWYGNFLRDYNTFDHKFFGKSPREISSTDPQHRLMLQAAYQAVEQSGYFHTNQDKHIGCYVGVGLVDYEHNIACAPANAYSATGNLKSFAAGKISHYFGWTGPGLTIDTACSSSAVAVHSACRAILTNECTSALAGGVNIMTSPEWFQNLAGASFLSPTGQCKPFDAKGDGYCRGEGVGAVFLKRYSAAVADGDQILGVIGRSAVYQNQSHTAITVPNAPSLSDLFTSTLQHAGILSKQVSYVEAHGTGTPVGDPAEYDSIRQVLGGSTRSNTLSLGSVKGLIGHTESASGIAALIKTVLMVGERKIPPQASFTSLNPQLKASDTDNIEISTEGKPWNLDFRAALINNYGASGSNACMVVTQAPQKGSLRKPDNPAIKAKKQPFWFCGLDEKNLRAYSSRMRRFLRARHSTSEDTLIANLSFQLSRQSNRSLPHSLVFSCSSPVELEEKLTSFENGQSSISASVRPSSKPVILCFGGQNSTFVGLDKHLYDQVKILRNHLDRCNAICRKFGLELYPEIFHKTPVEDIVKFQVILFATQYSCAQCWIDCGVSVEAVVGFSFGELAALCVSGVLSLQDAIKMVAGRARLIKDQWGAEKGAMMAVETELVNVQRLLADSSRLHPSDGEATIACYSGPTSFTLAGSTSAIDGAAKILSEDSSYASVKSKRLNVTNAFHCGLVEPLLNGLETIGNDLKWNEPEIPIHLATESESTDKLTGKFVADHMRNPVFFSHAAKRLAQKFPSSIWLEAGSNSTITTLASRALLSPGSSVFQSTNLASDNALSFLTDATTNLWKEGLNFTFWPHHRTQMLEYEMLILPPYQFEKAKHWIDLKAPSEMTTKTITQTRAVESAQSFWTFIAYQDDSRRSAKFRINNTYEKFREHVESHVIAQTAPLCPSTLQFDIAVEALRSLQADVALQPQLQSLVNHAPLGLDQERSVWLDAQANDLQNLVWEWKITSTNERESGSRSQVTHVSGIISFRSPNDTVFLDEFARYERLFAWQGCKSLLSDTDPDEVITGNKIYYRFEDIVKYGDIYRGLQKLVGKDYTSAGRISKKYQRKTWLDAGLADVFCQVAGVFVNTMTDRPDSDVYISDKISQWIRSPKLTLEESRPEMWEVVASHHRLSEKEFVSDVFVFDSRNGALLEVIFGIHYQRIPKAILSKALSKSKPPAKDPEPHRSSLSTPTPNKTTHPTPTIPPVNPPSVQLNESDTKKENEKTHNITGQVRDIICNLSGLEPEEIKEDSDLIELGIDSLMGMELAREIDSSFKCTLNTDDMVDLVTLRELVSLVMKTLGITAPNDTKNASPQANGESSEHLNRSPQVNGITSQVNGMPQVNGVPPQVNGIQPSVNGVVTAEQSELPAAVVLQAFKETKQCTDRTLVEGRMSGYVNDILPKSTELCVAHIVEAFERLDCSLIDAKPGQQLKPIGHLERHNQFVDFIYDLLEKQARLIDVSNGRITRTSIPTPKKSAKVLMEELVASDKDHCYDHQLTYLTGTRLAQCLTGEEDGLQLIFGTPEGREIASNMYGKSPINTVWIRQMEDFLKGLMKRFSGSGPIKILEMGAGTGGTTSKMIPLLASLGTPINYTVTDLSASLVANARKRFKSYPFVEFKVLDIEKEPSPDMLHSQHIVLATNCVHATHSLVKSTSNIHQLLRPDGFLMMLEMTQTLPWIDLIFGLLEGWWLFDDGRHHALQSPEVWEKTLHSVGYGHVDWTDGNLPEAAIQRIIIAMASEPRYDRAALPPKVALTDLTDHDARQAVIDDYVAKYTISLDQGREPDATQQHKAGNTVLITGATGSLGAFLVECFAKLESVDAVVCMNRPSSMEAKSRQQQALRSRGLSLSFKSSAKLRIVETDTSKPKMGLSAEEYEALCQDVSCIVHNAWPMSITRPVTGFVGQFKAMQNLIQLAQDCQQTNCSKVSFQFISSIATVGYHPIWTEEIRVPEQPMTARSVLPTGYGDAKLVCERMLEETLIKHPSRFHSMVVRIGQIAGSSKSGYWNPVEHFSFIIKSSQTLRALPDLTGGVSLNASTHRCATC